MAIVRWDPAAELSSLHGDVNRIFNSFFAAPENGSARRWVPAMDLYETASHFVATLDVPGVREDAIDIEVRDNQLSISGERAVQQQDEVDGWYRFERRSGRFVRQLQLPEGVDPDAISAALDAGVLEVRIPKPEARKPHRVQIGRSDAVEG